jgi:hypothetical protein
MVLIQEINCNYISCQPPYSPPDRSILWEYKNLQQIAPLYCWVGSIKSEEVFNCKAFYSTEEYRNCLTFYLIRGQIGVSHIFNNYLWFMLVFYTRPLLCLLYYFFGSGFWSYVCLCEAVYCVTTDCLQLDLFLWHALHRMPTCSNDLWKWNLVCVYVCMSPLTAQHYPLNYGIILSLQQITFLGTLWGASWWQIHRETNTVNDTEK